MAAAKRVTKVKSVNCILSGLVGMSAGDGLITSCSEWVGEEEYSEGQ